MKTDLCLFIYNGNRLTLNKTFQDLNNLLSKSRKNFFFVRHLLLQHLNKIIARSSEDLIKILQDILFFCKTFALARS